MDNKILLTNTRLDKEEITKKMIALASSLAEGVATIMPKVINAINYLVKATKPIVRKLLRAKRYTELKCSLEFIRGAKQNPKLNHLANHAKKRRVRNKNIKRLYRLGQAYYESEYSHASKNGDN